MELHDPATGQVLPDDAIQRVLFLANAVHVYNIPPLTSTRGYNAAAWTADPARHIFTARLRIVETSQETPGAADPESLKIDVVLEDASTGQLFAAAPYADKNVVEPVLDSSRFFAVTVRDPSGRRAVLGIGFEERAEAFDLGVALQEARRALGWEGEQSKAASAKEDNKDYSLKDGETITIDLGSSKTHRRRSQHKPETAPAGPLDLQSFALAPPPGASSSSGGGLLPPPPSSQDIKIKKQRRQSAKDLGFDDGQFGEFA